MAKMNAGSTSLEARSGELMSIPLSLLDASPRNARKTDGRDVSDLKATIKAQGVLHNLIVCPQEGSGKRGGKAQGSAEQHYEVVGGLRRLRALRELAAEGELDADEAILCRVKPSREAAEASLVENVARQAMHPADEFDAFKALVDEGRTVEEVARRFGTSVVKVRRCLKLADMHPQLVELYRQDSIELDQLKALALLADPAEQWQVWQSLPDWQRDARSLRRMLVQQDIDASSDPVARYVGVEAYEAAGGAVRRDLFSDEDGKVYLLDAALLHRLAEAKLQQAAEAVRSEGWSWVEGAVRVVWSQLMAFGRCRTTQRAMTKKEKREHAGLLKRANALSEQLTQLCDVAGESNDEAYDEKVAALDDETQAARDAVDRFEAELAVYDAQALASGGALVAVGSQGEVEVHRGLVRPRPRSAAPLADRAVEEGGSDDEASDGRGGSKTPTGKPVHSTALMLNLTAHRTMAARAAMLGEPQVALVALLHCLVQRLLCDAYGMTNTPVKLMPHQAIAGFNSQVFDEARQRWGERMPGEADRLFGWLMGLSDAERAEVLALCVALTLNDVRDSERPSALDCVASALSLDMADWWQPTAAGYFSRVNKETILGALAEGAGEQAASSIKGVGRQELARVAERELKERRWLPGPLRAGERSSDAPESVSA